MAGAVDFFVSYTSPDRPWAKWIAWELEHAGHSGIVQACDMQPGSNFVLQMDHATRAAERTIAVLSPAFSQSPYCQAEWAAAFARDPTGIERRLVPYGYASLSPTGCWGKSYVDVVGLSPEQARDVLLAGVSAERGLPSRRGFPASSRASGCVVRRSSTCR